MANTPGASKPQRADAARFNVESSPKVATRPNETQEKAPLPEMVQNVEAETQQSADRVREQLVSENAGLSTASTPTPTTPAQPGVAPARQDFGALEPDDQVSFLLKLAHDTGLERAFRMAKHTNDAYVIDKFHDELVNRVLHNKNQENKP